MSAVNVQGLARKWKALPERKAAALGEVGGAGVGSLRIGADQGGNWTKGVSGIPSAGGGPVPSCHSAPRELRAVKDNDGHERPRQPLALS